MQPNSELLPNLIRVPPPEQLRMQARQTWNEYVPQIEDGLTGQGIQYLMRAGAPMIPAGLTAMQAGRFALNSPTVQSRIAPILTTRLGGQIIRGANAVGNNPLVQEADKAVSKLADWIF